MKEVKVAIDIDGDACYGFDGKWYGLVGTDHFQHVAYEVVRGYYSPYSKKGDRHKELCKAEVIHTYMVDDDGL